MFILEEPRSKRCILPLEKDMISVLLALGEVYNMVLHCPLWKVCFLAQACIFIVRTFH